MIAHQAQYDLSRGGAVDVNQYQYGCKMEDGQFENLLLSTIESIIEKDNNRGDRRNTVGGRVVYL